MPLFDLRRSEVGVATPKLGRSIGPCGDGMTDYRNRMWDDGLRYGKHVF